jgi:hypothetical protein
MAVWPPAQLWTWDRLQQLPGAHARHVRELCGRVALRTSAPGQGDRGGDRGGKRGAAVGTTAHLPGRVRLPVVCAARRAAWFGPLHARGGGSANRRCVCVYRVAVSTLSLWSAVYPRHLSARTARTGGRPVGAKDDRGGEQSWSGRADRARRAQDGTLGEVGGGVCGLEPGAARAGGGRRAQRRARAARARGRTDAGGGHR